MTTADAIAQPIRHSHSRSRLESDCTIYERKDELDSPRQPGGKGVSMILTPP